MPVSFWPFSYWTFERIALKKLRGLIIYASGSIFKTYELIRKDAFSISVSYLLKYIMSAYKVPLL